MSSGVIILLVILFLVIAGFFVAKKWGGASVKEEVQKDTTKEVIRIQEAGRDAEKATDALTREQLDKRLRELGLLVDDD